MKKSSLLTLSLVSLVALVGCGKKDAGGKKVNARKFDEAYAKFLEKNSDDDGYLTFEFHESGTLSYKQSVSGSGALVEVYFDEDEPTSQKYSGSFDFVTNPDTYEFEPAEVEGWSDEDYAAAAGLLEECYLTGSYWILSSMFYAYAYYGGLGYLFTSYPEDPEEEFEFPDDLVFSVSPYSIKFLNDGESEGEGFIRKTKGYEYMEYNKYGELVKYEYYAKVEQKGVEDASLDGKFEYKETITIKYAENQEQEQE